MKKRMIQCLPAIAVLVAISGCKTQTQLEDELNTLQSTLDTLVAQLGNQKDATQSMLDEISALTQQIQTTGDTTGSLQARLDLLHKSIDFLRVLSQEDSNSYTLVKSSTLIGNYLVFKNKDGDLFAVDPSEWTDNTSALGYWYAGTSVTTSFGLPRSVYGLTDLSNGTYEYQDGTSSWMFEDSSQPSKDLERIGGKIRNQKLARVADALIHQYGFSEERGIQAARMIHQWNELKKSRSLTDADANAFAREILGFDFNGIRDAMETGNPKSMRSLVANAARMNGTSPEAMNELIQALAE